jgi:hypothetical protein
VKAKWGRHAKKVGGPLSTGLYDESSSHSERTTSGDSQFLGQSRIRQLITTVPACKTPGPVCVWRTKPELQVTSTRNVKACRRELAVVTVNTNELSGIPLAKQGDWQIRQYTSVTVSRLMWGPLDHKNAAESALGSANNQSCYCCRMQLDVTLKPKSSWQYWISWCDIHTSTCMAFIHLRTD